MQILLACAKIMHEALPSKGLALHTPRFQQEAEAFAHDLAQYDSSSLQEILKCNRPIAQQNKLRYLHFFDVDNPPLPAILAYHGQAYKHLKAEQLSEETLHYADQHLWITSFLYGLLRPLDGIHPYRLEGHIELPSSEGKRLFEFWKTRLTDLLINTVKADDGILIHLSTEEFEHLFDWKRVTTEVQVIQPIFYVRKGDSFKVQAVWAKSCRGAMTRFLLTQQITNPAELSAFDYEGFHFLREENNQLIFVKRAD